MKTLSISEAARKIGRHRPAVYRLIESGALRRLPGCRIPLADLEKIPRQKADLQEVALRRIRRAGHDPRRILYSLGIAAQSADADTLIHAGRFLLDGNPDFLRTLEAANPPAVDRRTPDGATFVGMDFPAFIAARIRLYANKAPARIPPEATAPVLWNIFWHAALDRPFDTFPLFNGGWMRLAPDWQALAAHYCPKQETVLSFTSPDYRPTKAEKDAALYMEKHYPEEKDLYGLDNITPAVLLIVRAIIAARDGNRRLALDHLAALGVPPKTAAALDRLVSRILGRFRFSRDSESKIEAKDIDLAGLYRQTAESDDTGDGPANAGSNESLAPSPYDILDEKEQEELNAEADRNPDKAGLSHRDRALQGAADTGAAAYCVSVKTTRRAVIQALGITMKTLRRWAAPSRRSRREAD